MDRDRGKRRRRLDGNLWITEESKENKDVADEATFMDHKRRKEETKVNDIGSRKRFK